MGVGREVVWHQPTPQGTLAVVYMELDAPRRMFEVAGTSYNPFDQWFREKALEIHGIDLTQPVPPSQMVFDEPMP